MIAENSFIAGNNKQDTIAVIKNVKEYLKIANPKLKLIPFNKLQTEFEESLNTFNSQNLGKLLNKLEQNRDSKNGIHHYIANNENGTHPTLIRDARNVFQPEHKGYEAFAIQYVNAIRAAADVINHSELSEQNISSLKDQLTRESKKVFSSFDKMDNLNEYDSSEFTKKKILALSNILEENGCHNALKKMDIAKEYQSFNDAQHNIVTLTTIKNLDKPIITMFEAEVPMRGMIKEISDQYNLISVKGNEKPKWFEKLSSFEKKILESYAVEIGKGNHVLPTQLTKILGVRNAFEKITGVIENSESKARIKVLHQVKHSGTLASLNKGEDEALDIVNTNFKQVRSWVEDGNNSVLINSLNTGFKFIVDNQENKIVSQLSKVSQETNTSYFNTALNKFRVFDSSGDNNIIQEKLNQVCELLDPKNEDEQVIIRFLKQQKDQAAANFLLETDSLPKEIKEIIDYAINSKKALIGMHHRKANISSMFYRSAKETASMNDPENNSVLLSTNSSLLVSKLNILVDSHTNAIKNKSTTDRINNFIKSGYQKQSLIVMCKSGKDRTGAAMHDQTYQTIKDYLFLQNIKKPSNENIESQIISSGHTSQQAGGTYSLGATIGCFGVKSVIKSSIPKSRQMWKGLTEAAADNNSYKSFLENSLKNIVNDVSGLLNLNIFKNTSNTLGTKQSPLSIKKGKILRD